MLNVTLCKWGHEVGLTVVVVLVMNGDIVALRRLIVAAKSERWYDAALTLRNHCLCASG